MNDLRELFDDAVQAPPVSRLRAEDILGAARARRRRRTSVTALASLLATVVAGAAGVLLSRGTTDVAPSGAAPPGPVLWAGAAGANLVYALTDDCRAPALVPPAGPECYRLVSSTDGGPWADAGRLPDDNQPYVSMLGARTLLNSYVQVTAGPTPTQPGTLTFVGQVSVDGGRHWADLVPGPPIAAMPPDGAPVQDDWGANPTVKVYDPPTRQLRPLAHQPGLLHSSIAPQPPGAGIWVTGFDPATRRPAVAVSHDGGVVWSTTVFDGPALGDVPAGAQVALARPVTRDATVAYVLLPTSDEVRTPGPNPPTGAAERYRVVRSVDGGRTFGAPSAEPVLVEFASDWVTADGRIVVCPDEGQCRVSADGQSFVDAVPPGLPGGARVDGTIGYTSTTVYRSDDGWTWRSLGP